MYHEASAMKAISPDHEKEKYLPMWKPFLVGVWNIIPKAVCGFDWVSNFKYFHEKKILLSIFYLSMF